MFHDAAFRTLASPFITLLQATTAPPRPPVSVEDQEAIARKIEDLIRQPTLEGPQVEAPAPPVSEEDQRLAIEELLRNLRQPRPITATTQTPNEFDEDDILSQSRQIEEGAGGPGFMAALEEYLTTLELKRILGPEGVDVQEASLPFAAGKYSSPRRNSIETNPRIRVVTEREDPQFAREIADFTKFSSIPATESLVATHESTHLVHDLVETGKLERPDDIPQDRWNELRGWLSENSMGDFSADNTDAIEFATELATLRVAAPSVRGQEPESGPGRQFNEYFKPRFMEVLVKRHTDFFSEDPPTFEELGKLNHEYIRASKAAKTLGDVTESYLRSLGLERKEEPFVDFLRGME
jgi:hypothetical protein